MISDTPNPYILINDGNVIGGLSVCCIGKMGPMAADVRFSQIANRKWKHLPVIYKYMMLMSKL